MCVLCGEMISSFHWSDVNFKDSKQEERKRLRLKKTVMLNKILKFYGLTLMEWQNAKFILSDKKGQTVIVNDLGDLWTKADKLSSKELDVLDDEFLNFLSHG